jgi:hypothetical protein
MSFVGPEELPVRASVLEEVVDLVHPEEEDPAQ